ncbi:hypothetical protein CMI47_18900 [Candidatus Pacearchaeota archaeon]|nr:hypothetical protein [Candidatus Pacearchaeota archaeon]|tara:strand:+ start:18913 stop:19359 length:447 start_codon:yes stop_codon:yes gene_type:complete
MTLGMLLFLLSTFHGQSYAQDSDSVTTVQAGDIAPFSGTLFSTTAAARLLIDLESSQELCEIRTSEALDVQEAETQYFIEIEKIRAESCEERSSQIIDLKNEHIDFLTTEMLKRRGPSTSAWYVGGILTGILATSVGVWAVSQANTAN